GATFTLNLAANHFGHTFIGWSIDWGDGHTDTITGNPSTATHVYADGSDSFVIHANAADDTGTYAANTQSITVNNVAPTISLSGGSTVSDGVAYNLTLGAIADPGQDTISQYIVYWGDGTSDTFTSNGPKSHAFN